MIRFLMKTVPVGFAAVFFVSACAIQDGAHTGLRALSETDGAVVIETPPFDQGAEQRIIYASSIEREEYALFNADNRQSEIIYITTRHLHLTNLVIDQFLGLDEVLASFRQNQVEKPVQGEAFKTTARNIRYWAKPYQLPNSGKSCAAFAGRWDMPGDDLRASKALFGYYCEAGRAPLSADFITAFIGTIGVRGITANRLEQAVQVPRLTAEPSQQELLARVRGDAGGTRGNSRFPYTSVRHFNRGNDCRLLPNC
ncbi:MAG: hypothetical protein HQ483_11860 [Rhodospirillales bacterium]|nr:hypothetical protein [Rhodospirillales bacterium]